MTEGRTHHGESFDGELNRRIIRSSAWVALGHGGGQILSFASTLVLVRLLDPHAFGTVAVGVTLVAVISQIQESGLGSAFVQGRDRDQRVAASSVLVFAAAAAFVLAAVTVALAPLYTRLLHVPESTEFVQVLALMLAIRGLAVVPGAMLERELSFRYRTQAELSAASVQMTVAITCAVAGLGAWSLVAGLLAGSATQASVLWLRAPWYPSPFKASRSMLREMLRYGRFVSGTNVMVIANANLDNAVVARFLGVGSLGVYNIAWRLAELPATVIGVIVGRVMFSVYSRLQHDLDAVRAAYIQNLQRTMLFALPLAVTLGVAAEPIVLGLLGSDWKGAIGPLRLLAVFGLVRLLIAPSGDLFRGIGRPHLSLAASITFFAVALPSLLVLVPRLGTSGAALAMLAGVAASGGVLLTLTFRALELRPYVLARALARPAACAGIVAVALVAALPEARALGALAALGLVAAVATGAFLIAVALLGRSLLIPIWAGLRRS
ncbi:MAG: lipopolysaccharide biosynthesis protein [Actinomycetota bacterium]|nr:lipopolysaccharide biosynthesis protein [Actinomycetota bacterium]